MELWAIQNWDKFEEIKEAIVDGEWYNGIVYNQELVSNYSCSIHWPLTVLSNLYWFRVNLELRKKLWKEALKEWAVKWKGRYTKKWVEFIRKFFSDFVGDKIHSYTLKLWSDDAEYVLDSWNWLVVSYKGNKILDESIKDWILDDDEPIIWEQTYWHITSLFKEDWVYKIVDSFNIWNWENIRTIKNKETLDKLVEKWVFYKNSYALVLLQSENMEEIEKQNLKCLLYNLKNYYNNWQDIDIKNEISEIADMLRLKYDFLKEE